MEKLVIVTSEIEVMPLDWSNGCGHGCGDVFWGNVCGYGCDNSFGNDCDYICEG